MSGVHEDGWVTDLGAYRALPPLLDFAACVDPAQYRPLSPDWVVIITDVRGSTAAIEAGRYREVNQVGAMGIAALKNELGSLDFPFVFGGDGATFALPRAEAREALPVLCGVKRIAAEQFGLDLRVGCLPLDAVAGPGVGPGLSVARYAITPGLCSTLFAGGALGAAEARIKAEPGLSLDAGDPLRVDLGGLSCRWEPIPTTRGVTLSLLVEADAPETYRDVLALLGARCPGLESPVALDGLRYSAPAVNRARDLRFSAHAPLELRQARMAELGAFTVMMGEGPGADPLRARALRQANRSHSDHKKFDELLRMVIDCAPADRDAIEAQLDAWAAQGRVRYGTHAADHALMTCLVNHMDPGGHVHFIDGGDGGYALAAKRLKARTRPAHSQR